jgi:hypothetical protein
MPAKAGIHGEVAPGFRRGGAVALWTTERRFPLARSRYGFAPPVRALEAIIFRSCDRNSYANFRSAVPVGDTAMPRFRDEEIQKLFGREDAENEVPSRLKEFFFRNKAYENLTSDLPIRILVGHKGTGKSALLKIAYSEDQEKDVLSLWLRPDDVRAVVPEIATGDLNARIDGWKRALTQLIAREILEVYGAQAIEVVTEGKYGRLKDIVSLLKEAFSKRVNIAVDSIKKTVIENFLRTGIIRIYLDDLDRGWEARPQDIRNISALLNAIRDLCGARSSLQFRLGLRSDVYFLVRTSDESTDKIEQNIIFLTWDNHQILVVAAKRIGSYFGESVDELSLLGRPPHEVARYLHKVIEPTFTGEGKWSRAPIHRVLLSLVRKRPRDLVKLLSGAAREAYRNNHEVISTEDLRSTFESYSNERLQDLVNEFKTEMPTISNLLRGMRPVRRERTTAELFLYTNDQLSQKLKNLMQQNHFIFTNGARVDVHSLGQLLYKIDFIIARKDQSDGRIVRKYFDQNRYLQDQFVDFGFDWEVHPAYRWGLQPASGNEIYHNIAFDSEADR